MLAMRNRVFLAFAVAATFAGGVALTYEISFATERGRRADARVFEQVSNREADSLRRFGHRVGKNTLNGAAAAGVLALGALLCVLTFAGRTRLRVWIIPVLIAGSFTTTELLKGPLGRLGRELAPLRIAVDAYPSGHATLAMAIVLSFVMAAPSRTRTSTTIAGAVVAVVLGLLIVVGALHPPSDVIGGYLVAGAWAALLTPFVRHGQPTDTGARRAHMPGRLGMGVAGAVLVSLAVLLGAYVEDAFGPHRMLLGLVGAFALASTVVVAAIGVLSDLAEPSAPESVA
jgi:membrane-associated phospholipid phosphatase